MDCIGFALIVNALILLAVAGFLLIKPRLVWLTLLPNELERDALTNETDSWLLDYVGYHVGCFAIVLACLNIGSQVYHTNLVLRASSSIITGLLALLLAIVDALLLNKPKTERLDDLCMAVHLSCALVVVFVNSTGLMVWFCRSKEFGDSEQQKRERETASQKQGSLNQLAEPLLQDDAEISISSDTEEKTNTHTHNKMNKKEEKPESYGCCRLLSLAKPETKWLVAGCIALLVRLPFSLAVPHFVSEVIGGLIDNKPSDALNAIICLVIAGSIDSLLDFWNYFLFGYAQQRLIKRLRIDLFRSILRQDITFFDSNSSGQIASRLSADTSEMANDLTWVFRFTIEAFVRIGGITAYMFIREPKLAAVAVSVIPICAVVNKIYGNWLHNNAKKVQTALAAANGTAQETISSFRTVFSFASEKYEQDRYAYRVQTHYSLNVKQIFMQALYYMFVATFLINTCVQAVILYVGVLLFEWHELDPKVLIAFMLYQGQLQEYCSNLFNSFTNLIKSSGAGQKVFEILDQVTTKTRFDNRSSDVELPATFKGRLEVCGVNFSYPTRSDPVLKSVGFAVDAGEVVALVGPSGGGKSTIFHLIERYYDPAKGRVLLDGISLMDIPHILLHRVVGLVGQEPVLFSGTIRDNIMYSANVGGENQFSDEKMIEAARIANAHTFVSALEDGYATEVGERGVQLSGGQKQRIAIARAIIHDPAVLLLDEATSALDSESEAIVQEALERAMKGRTTLIIAHRLSTIKNADRIIVLDKGRVVESGTHTQLMASDRPNLEGTICYKNLVERQLGHV